MSSTDRGPAYSRFMDAADAAAHERPEVDRDLAREVLGEAATMLHDGLAFDGLDPHDTEAVVAALAVDLLGPDPGAAVRERSRSLAQSGADLHDPEAASASCLVAASILRL